jgi:hypothetical protein
MQSIEVIFWVVLALIWLVSGSLIRRRTRKEKETYEQPEEEPVEIFPREEKSEEESIPVGEKILVTLPPVKEREIPETMEVKEEPKPEVKVSPALGPICEKPEIELNDLETLRRWILISEILGPPRAKRYFRKIR